MNLQQTQVLQTLKEPPKKTVVVKKRSRLQVAKRVFQLAAQGGFPYTGMTAEQWAKSWLPSKEFVLCEVNIHAAASINMNVVASPHPPKNPNRVNHYLQCSIEAMDPIVVDLNRRKVGRSYLGYVPEIVVLDGKHRKKAQLQQGRTRILAWVGAAALKLMPEITVRTIDASTEKCTLPPLNPRLNDGRKNATYQLFAEQSNAVKACGARSSGSLEDDTSNSDHKVPPDSSDDGSSVEASDRLGWNPDKAQNRPPGSKGWSSEVRGRNNPVSEAPGAGVGPRLNPNTGATRSELSRSVSAKGKVVKEMYEDDDVDAVAPPGREDQVRTLKKKVGKKAAFKIAWSQQNKGKKK